MRTHRVIVRSHTVDLARLCLAPSFLAFLIVGSWAEEQQPPRTPTRDVDITYKITRPTHPPVTHRVRWSAAELVERIDGPKRSTSIFNHRNDEVTLLNGAYHTYVKLEGAPRQPIESELGVQLKRSGESVAAGLRCTEWSWTEDEETHTACMTSDGVLLRLLVDGKTIVEARAVTYHQQPPELFQVPKGYEPALAPEGAHEP